MITEFSKYNPKIGYFVIITIDPDLDSFNFFNYFKNNVGEIVEIKFTSLARKYVNVKYENVPKYMTKDSKYWDWDDVKLIGDDIIISYVFLDELIYISDSKEELDMILLSNKYNL